MHPKTLQLLQERAWIPLTKHLEALPSEERLEEMADLADHLEKTHPNPGERKRAMNAVVWDRMLTDLKRTEQPYTPKRTAQALDIVEAALRHRAECILELIPGVIEKIHENQTQPSNAAHTRMVRSLDNLSNHVLAQTETHDEAKALKIHLENKKPRSPPPAEGYKAGSAAP